MKVIFTLIIILLFVDCSSTTTQVEHEVTGLWEITSMKNQTKGLTSIKKDHSLIGLHVLIDSNTVILKGGPVGKDDLYYYKKPNDTMYFSSSLNGGTIQKVNIKKIINERIEAEFFKGILFEDSLLLVAKKIIE